MVMVCKMGMVQVDCGSSVEVRLCGRDDGMY